MRENNLMCAGCGKSLTGAYITALNQTWHEDCFRCAGCRQPLGKQPFYQHDGQPYHAACYHDRFSPRCAHCGKPVTDGGKIALGRTWHNEHFLCAGGQEPLRGVFYEREGKAYCDHHYQALFGMRCAADGKLIGRDEYYEKDGKTYCADHYWQKFGKRCAIGGEILKNTYQVNAWGDTYCAGHATGLTECYSCHRLICERLTGGGVSYRDERAVCNRCRQTAIDTAEQGQPVLTQVRRALARLGLEIGPATTPLRLVDQYELNRRSTKPYSTQPTGMACHQSKTRNGQVVERQVEAILILFGLPREHFATVAAHELMHSYLFMNAFPELEPVVEEGLCELAAYLWLKQQGTPEAAYRMALMDKNENPVYGKGFQLARHSLDKMSLQTILKHVQTRRRFP